MRKLKVICSSAVAAVIGVVGASQPAWAQVVDTVTLTVGHYPPACLSGYSQGFAGSLSPNTLTGGKTVFALAEDSCNNRSVLTVSSSTTPWQAWLSSVDCGTFVLNSPDAQFSYRLPQPVLGLPAYGSWTWTLPLGFTFLPAGTVVTCAITHS